MARTRRTLLSGLAGTGALVLAGCVGDDGGSGGSESDEDIHVRSHSSFGDILVRSDGRTVYMFESDEQGAGASSCDGSCADSWPPVTVEGEPSVGDSVEAEVTTFERDDGSTQVAVDGWPVYLWQNDENAGDTNGQGVNDVWWVLDPAGAPVKEATGGAGGGGGGY